MRRGTLTAPSPRVSVPWAPLSLTRASMLLRPLLRPLLRHALTASTALVLTACASSGGSAPEPAIRTIGVTDNGQIQTSAPVGELATFETTPDQLFRAVQAAYADLGIETTEVNDAARRVGNPALVRRRQFGNTNLSQYFECGSNFTGLRADSDRLTIHIMSSVTAAGAGRAEVQTLLSATAKPMDGASTAPADCSSTGRLERLLKLAITKRLGAP